MEQNRQFELREQWKREREQQGIDDLKPRLKGVKINYLTIKLNISKSCRKITNFLNRYNRK